MDVQNYKFCLVFNKSHLTSDIGWLFNDNRDILYTVNIVIPAGIQVCLKAIRIVKEVTEIFDTVKQLLCQNKISLHFNYYNGFDTVISFI